MSDGSRGLVEFLGVAADRRLLTEDAVNLPAAEQPRQPAISTRRHDRLVRAGSVLTGVSLIGGTVMLIAGVLWLLFEGGGALAGAIAAVGAVLAATHWGWVHVAEYAGLTIDARQQREIDERSDRWLAAIQPYPRFSVTTSVLDDASTRVEEVLHQPVLTGRGTFTFVRRAQREQTFDADTPAATLAVGVEAMRRQARLETDRLEGLWEAAATTYAAALRDAENDQERLAARRAAAAALSEHLNASLLEPPLVE